MDFVLEDSRRLTGANLIFPGAGAVLDVRCPPPAAAALVPKWRARVAGILSAVGWPEAGVHVRRHATGVSLAIAAPIDALYAATEVNEWALEAAVADLGGGSAEPIEKAAARLRARIAEEVNPALLRLADAAARHSAMFLFDDERASVGAGRGSRTWAVDDLPGPADVPWDEVFDVPVVMVTGTNGKTTTVRLLAAMATEAGRTPGFSSTDGVYAGSELVEAGDFSGPGGARSVLRDQRVDVAILEVARGGMLRRGLGAPRADAVLVTNVGIDHLGEYGLHDIEQMADAKLVISRAVESGGALVLNADDPVLARRGPVGTSERVWISRFPDRPPVADHVARGGRAVVADEGRICRVEAGEAAFLVDDDEPPLTLAGAAAYNVENILGAFALAPFLGISDAAAVAAIRSFAPTPEALPGRTNVFRLGAGVIAILDFAHNPHGMRALADMASRLSGGRRLVVVGQAGDRDDESIRELARSALELEPDRIIVKELDRYRRGRAPGEVPGIIVDELEQRRTRASISTSPGELDAVREALQWAEAGDLLILPVQAEREPVRELLGFLTNTDWSPGDPLPEAVTPQERTE